MRFERLGDYGLNLWTCVPKEELEAIDGVDYVEGSGRGNKYHVSLCGSSLILDEVSKMENSMRLKHPPTCTCGQRWERTA